MEEKKIICAECGKEISEDEARFVNGKAYCEDCFDDEFIVCSCCGEIVRRDYAYVGADDCEYCEECFEERFAICDDCGEVVYRDDLISIDDGDRYVCSDCASDNYYYCEDCGCYYSEDNIEWDEADDCYYCNDCASRHQHNINEYHDSHDRDVTFFGGEDDGKTLFMGCEVEVDNGSDADDTAGEMKETMPFDFVTQEYDGSLNSGFENITQPATLKYHESIKSNYEDMFQIAVRNGFRSHDTTTCGFHVHFNRTFFEDKEEECIAKLLYLVEKFWDELVKFSRRKYDSLERWASKYTDSPEVVIEKMKNWDLDRYHAVNLTNDATIEFRMFRGTLNIKTFFATLQLVDTIVRICKEKTSEELQDLKFTDLLITDELKEYWEKVKDRVVR